MPAKTEIVKYAMDSLSYIRRALKSINQSNALEMIPHAFAPLNAKTERLALVGGYASHGWEHHGQMVVYQRINSIVPGPSPLKLTD
jgi:hypothetical protein